MTHKQENTYSFRCVSCGAEATLQTSRSPEDARRQTLECLECGGVMRPTLLMQTVKEVKQ